MATSAAGGVASPCINICRMHPASGWCEGCLRTLDEIAAWGQLDDAGRRQVLQRLGLRRVAWRALQQTAAVVPAATGPESPP
jgi:hypothetical protein